jgi:hypothetical protein
VAGDSIYISSIVLFELWYGVSRSARPYSNAAGLEDLLARGVEVLPFLGKDATYAGRIRDGLERIKQPIGPYDTLIAGQAVAGVRSGSGFGVGGLGEFVTRDDWLRKAADRMVSGGLAQAACSKQVQL